MSLDSFIFGGNTGISGPQELARRRAIAQALMANFANDQPKTIGEGLGAVADAISARRAASGLDAAERSGLDSANAVWGNLAGAFSPQSFPAAPGQQASGDYASQRVAQASGDAPGPTNDYFSAIRAAESAGNDSAKASTSSATGRYQFTKGTWADVAQAHPELGLTLDGRLDPAQQEKAIRAFTADNAATLGRAGIDATGGNLYAAHFLGASGATGVLTKPDNTPMAAAVPPEVIRANPFLSNMTVGDFRQWAARKGGGNAPVQVASASSSPLDDYTASGIYDPAKQFRGSNTGPKAPDPLVYSDPTNMPDPLIEALKWATGWGGQQSQTLPPDRPMPSGPVSSLSPSDLATARVAAAFAPQPGGNPASDAITNALLAKPVAQPVSAAPQAAPPLPPPTTMQDRPIAEVPQAPSTGKPQGPGQPGEVRRGSDGQTYQYAETTGMAGAAGAQGWIPFNPAAGGGDQNIPVMAGGSGGAITRDAQGGPDLQMLMQAAGNPWLNDTQGKIVESLLGQKLAAPKYDFVTGRDGAIFRTDQSGNMQQVYGGRPKASHVLTPAEKAQFGLPVDGNFQADEEGKISQIGGNGTTVNIDQKTESAFDKALATKQADSLSSMATDGLNAKADLAVIDQLDGLLKNQGGTLTGLAGIAAKYGVGTEGMDDLQAAQALINKLIPTQRQPGSGSMSDRDAEMFARSLPSLWNSPGGNQKILGVMRGLAQYKQAQGDIAAQVMSGDMTRQDATKALRALPNPLAEFSNPSAAPKTGPQPGAVEDGYRFKGGDPSDQGNWEKVQ